MIKTIEAALKEAEILLDQAGIEQTRHEARYLLCFVTGWPLQTAVAYPEKAISDGAWEHFLNLIQRRAKHEPLAHITGVKEFWSLPFIVTSDTLIPRPDSETLIETILDYYPDHDRSLKILDLGVGSGCLLISALTEYPNATGIGVDQSQKALLVAEENAKKNGVDERCQFIQSSWCEKIDQKFDLILANPPYIDVSEKNVMSREVLEFEPESALFADQNGLEAYMDIADELNKVLTEEGLCLFEVGFRQAEKVSNIMTDRGLKVKDVRNDMNDIARVVVVQT